MSTVPATIPAPKKKGRQGPLPDAEKRAQMVRGIKAIGQVIGVNNPRSTYYLVAIRKVVPAKKDGGIWVADEAALVDYVRSLVTSPTDSSAASQAGVARESAKAAPAPSGRRKRWDKRKLRAAQPDTGARPAGGGAA
jgi:hypothetical protein